MQRQCIFKCKMIDYFFLPLCKRGLKHKRKPQRDYERVFCLVKCLLNH